MKHAIVFGRFNPPTIGHSLLLKALDKYARSGDTATIYLSHSSIQPVDYRRAYKLSKDLTEYSEIAKVLSEELRNPLTWEQKVAFVTRIVDAKGYNVDVSTEPELVTLDRIFMHLAEQGDTDLILLAGSDRLPEFTDFVNRYNNAQPKNLQVNVDVMSAGKRDPDADDVSGISATRLRYLAACDDFEGFQEGIDGDKELAWDIFNAVTAAMNIPEECRTTKRGNSKKVEHIESELHQYLLNELFYG